MHAYINIYIITYLRSCVASGQCYDDVNGDGKCKMCFLSKYWSVSLHIYRYLYLSCAF